MNQSQKYDLYDDMSYLKDKILDLLQLYNSKESNTNQGLKEVKQKVKQNAKVIAKEYS